MASTTITGKGKVIIFRGLPGSGKSYKGRAMLESFIKAHPGVKNAATKLSTDDFWGLPDVRGFDGKRIQEAHAWNIKRAAKALFEDKYLLVIIDNTNTKAWEAKPYAFMAAEAGYDIEIVESDTPWCRDVKACHQKTVERSEVPGSFQGEVPEKQIQGMFDRWEYDLTPEKILATELRFAWEERNFKVAIDLIQEIQAQKDE